ncbi:MAG: hypothetical protein KAJ42_04035, partial [Gemmatimonadetes bacterium]|nr:hypothetical protein [Gemmatimonadota bacterium]
GILGQEEYDRLTADRKAEEATQEAGPSETPDAAGDPALDALVVKHANDDGYLSIANVKAILEEMPNAFDRVFGWELARAEGPRVGALNHLLELEMKREGGPRHLVQQRIELSLKEIRGK